MRSKRVSEMNDREYAAYKSRRAALYRRKQVLFSLAVTAVLIVLFSALLKGISSNAASVDNGKCKYYRTEMLRYDMTLEDMAKENFNPEYFSSVAALKKEIMEVNHIDENSAIPGGLILYVPYYGEIH